MKLAVYTVSLPEYDLAESVAVLKEMGYEGVEWRVDKTEGESPLKAMFANLPAEQQAAIERHLDVHSFPTYKLFDREGNLLDIEVDARQLEELVRLLEQLK